MKRASGARTRAELASFLDNLFFCPSCTTWRKSRSLSGSFQGAQRAANAANTRRCASTLSSTTAVNATKNVPSRYKGLYQALKDVRTKAPGQVNLSRLQLALQGLESETPTTRVAVLGLNVQNTARRLVRLLLADPLRDEERWEKDFLKSTDDASQGLLIRFGHPSNPNLPRARTTIPVLRVPSNVLERNNIEIMVASIPSLRNGDLQGMATITSDAFLSPSIGTPTAANGRQTMISQPVHSSLLVTQGLDEMVLAAELLASTNFVTKEDRDLVRLIVNLENIKQQAPGTVLIVDATQAEEGLAAIRRSVAEARSYEHKWVGSGLPELSNWLTLSSASQSNESIPRPLRNLISSIISHATRNLSSEAMLEARSSQARSLSPATQAQLETSIEEFSRNAHQELQSGLASAWSSRNWRKLAWYKLFWRVDDVGLIITDLVTNAWLPRTERAVYELSGRLSQAGVSPIDISAAPPSQGRIATSTEPTSVLQAQSSLATDPAVEPVIVNTTGTAELRLSPTPQPSPLSSSISHTRAQQIERAILGLTSTAQQIVLKTLSLSGISAGLSALTYLSLTSGSMYEAGTVVALGTAYALWRMQGDWHTATKALEEDLLDEGRTVIQRIVGGMHRLVENGSRVGEDSVEVQTRLEAEQAVAKARDELSKLGKES
ncbi:uncharacterized protein A1O9_09066 [Exophiala aquamarina CBS 119918]|uniref:Mmc1 C-terminal domain-containing protein n=1 Tax=Exophiala aquamarina CBS 119918 TaxID=1182545 RepID=A0A072P3B9_9EURO|nr:uncharacterized protein A1O9_09066 [Exophiala aquamarina CBS 119918]KEF54624.1 hypothetical protein A1O9_09066 [Exophiala aquamarina CBS 119918]